MEKEILKWGQLTVSKDSASKVIIHDDIDCDMTFYFELIEDTERRSSYTNYEANSESEATIYIINPQKGPLRPERMIEVGTYNKTKRLFMEYVLAAQDDGKDIYDKRKLDYFFYICPFKEK